MTGWKWGDVEDLRLPDLMSLTEWWREHPPMAYAGKGESERSAPGVPPEDATLDDEGLVGLLGGGK